MANIVISKIKVRRGTNDQRKQIILDQGELGYTIDTNRLFVGNGTKVGGNAIGSKIHPPIESISSLTSVVAEIGDIVWVNGIFYQLIDDEYDKIESWKNIGTYLDSTYFEYNNLNRITLKNNVIKLANLASDVTNKFLTLADESTIEYGVNNKLTIKNSGVSNTKIQNGAITNDKINLNVVGNGLIGGAGQSISINADPNLFYFENGRLMLYEANFATSVDNVTVKINANNEFAVKENAITETYINNLAFSDGIVGGNGSKIRLNANPDVFTFTNSKLDLQSEFIDESKLKSSIFTNGIKGGDGNKVNLNIDNSIFGFDAISALTIKLSSIEGKYLSEFAFGDGLIKDSTSQQVRLKTDPTFFSYSAQTLQIASSAINYFQISPEAFGEGIRGGGDDNIRIIATDDFSFLSGALSLRDTSNDNLSAGVPPFSTIFIDRSGRLMDNTAPGIIDTLSGFSTNNMFNGSVLQNSRNTNQTFMSAVNSSNEIVRLSSAGFIAFESGLTTLSGVALSSKPLRRFAIPVFTF
jgi:hypothetical protein